MASTGAERRGRSGTKRTAFLAVLILPCTLSAQVPVPGEPGAERERHTVAGSDAWEVARRAGFEFRPVAPDDGYIITGPPDGARTALKACADPVAPCEPEAEVVEGRVVVLAPTCSDGCVRSHAFELFGGRPLASGWTVVAVEIEGTGWSWGRRPRPGDRSPGLRLRVEARTGAAGRAHVRTITLDGPAGAAWPDAFRIP